jgi:hypothetical protein
MHPINDLNSVYEPPHDAVLDFCEYLEELGLLDTETEESEAKNRARSNAANSVSFTCSLHIFFHCYRHVYISTTVAATC